MIFAPFGDSEEISEDCYNVVSHREKFLIKLRKHKRHSVTLPSVPW